MRRTPSRINNSWVPSCIIGMHGVWRQGVHCRDEGVGSRGARTVDARHPRPGTRSAAVLGFSAPRGFAK